MGHLKRYAMPKFWSLPRKEKMWVVKPLAGPHAQKKSVPLLILLRDVLNYADTAKEVQYILNKGGILVDKKVRKEPKYPLGLMDVLEISEMKKYFRITTGRRGLSPKEVPADDAKSKLCKIQNKVLIKRGMIQLNLHDGRNILVKDRTYKPGDSLLIQLPDQKILNHFKLEKNANALIFDGKNAGVSGKIKDIHNRKNMLETSTVTLLSDGKEIVTLKDYIFVLPGSEEKITKKPVSEKNTIAKKLKKEVTSKNSKKSKKRGSK